MFGEVGLDGPSLSFINLIVIAAAIINNIYGGFCGGVEKHVRVAALGINDVRKLYL